MRRGEVWLVNFDPTVGDEIRKTRPALIVSDDAIGRLALKVVVPITEWSERYAGAPWFVRVQPSRQNGLAKLSAIDTFQVRSVSQRRFIRRLGSASDRVMQQVTDALAVVLNLDA